MLKDAADYRTPAGAAWAWRLAAAVLIVAARGAAPGLPRLRLPARPGPRRGPLLGLVAPPRLELLQQGPAGRLPDPRPAALLAGPLVGARCTGTDMLAVRLPAVRLRQPAARQPLRPHRPGLPAARGWPLASSPLALTLPLVAAGSSLMTIDAPVHLLLGLGAGARPPGRLPPARAWAWPVAGLRGRPRHPRQVHDGAVPAVAGAVPADYAGAPPRCCGARASGCMAGVGGAVLSADPDLERRSTTGSRSGTSAARPGCDGRRRRALARARSTTSAGSSRLLLGFWFVVWAGGDGRLPARGASRTPAGRYLWWMSVPMFAVLPGLQPQDRRRRAELAGDGVPVRAWCWRRGWLAGSCAIARPLVSAADRRRALAAACVLGLALTVLVHRSELAQPLLACAGRAADGRAAAARCGGSTRPAGCAAGGRWRRRWTDVRDELRGRGRRAGAGRRRLERCRASWASTATGSPTVYSLGPGPGRPAQPVRPVAAQPGRTTPDAFRGGRSSVVGGRVSPALARGVRRSVEPPRSSCTRGRPADRGLDA